MTMFPKPKDSRRKRHDIVDGMQFRFSKSMNVMQEFCTTKTARERRRREIYERDGRRCVKCRRPVRFDAPDAAEDRMHWHHKLHKSLGGDDSMKNGDTLCKRCHLVDEHHHI